MARTHKPTPPAGPGPQPAPPVPPPPPADPAGRRWDVPAITGFVLAAAGSAANIVNPEFPAWLAVVCILALVACTAWFTFRLYHPLARRVARFHQPVATSTPWLVLLTLILCVTILYFVLPGRRVAQIKFDNGTGAVFNSWDGVPDHKKRIQAAGAGGTLAWGIEGDGSTGWFSYKTDKALPAAEGISSGAYLTFYGRPCDRLQYRTLRFRCRATAAPGAADVGVRIAVDNPREKRDRELITYEVASLRRYAPVDGSWRTYEIPIGDFRQVRYQPPFPANLINKIVFFVNAEISDACPDATLWFADIAFHH